MSAVFDSSEIFNNLSARITQLLYGPTKDTRSLINKTLDELNSINYKYPVVQNGTKAVLLVNQCCSLIPPEDRELVLKCCELITSLIARQSVVVEGRTQTVAVLWGLQALRKDAKDADILLALESLLRVHSKHDLITEIVKSQALLSLAKDKTCPEVALFALQCLEACTSPPENAKDSNFEKFPSQFRVCFDIFLDNLQNYKSEKLVNIKILAVCLRGIQNILVQNPQFLHENLGIILGIVKSYMLFNLKDIEFFPPQKLLPSAFSIPEPCTNLPREKKGGKMTKQRKQKTQPALNKKQDWNSDTAYIPANSISSAETSSSNRLKTSDSDFSDTEGGNTAKTVVISGRVRQAALNLFLNTAKLTEKNVMFSYWSSFIPENHSSTSHNLITSILRDSSARGRMVALNVLLSLLTSSKLYLAQAEKGENLSFTPFSVIIGLTLKELHRCLSLALCENSVLVLIQVLKCFAALVQATPYHKLAPGLISKITRNVKTFIHHKDPAVQVTALIVLGCVLASEPVCAETLDAFTKNSPEIVEKSVISAESVEFVDFSDEDLAPEEAPSSSETPWLLQKCLSNLHSEKSTSIAVKLESLQVISAMSRNHFEGLLGRHLARVTEALDAALVDKYTNVRLHAGRAVDFIGQAMNRYFSTAEKQLAPEQCLLFWHVLLNGSLPSLLSSEEHVLRATGCDCFGSIGAFAFEQLPRERQILFVTLLFSCSRDDENSSVRAASVRALAICVLFSPLREDAGFVVDTAEAILRALDDENLTVRIKSSWALGNLSDALVLNRNTASEVLEELPRALILKLLKSSIKASSDNDKIRMNAVRALGNFLQLVGSGLIDERDFSESVRNGFEVLVKNAASGSNMKVRWNSCYALGNAMRNSALFGIKSVWGDTVFGALTELVVHFKNFKVRINAAVALAAPARREFYGDVFQKVWASLCKALETSQNMDDFNEYKHRDHLVEQICLTLGHLVKLLAKEDLLQIENSVSCDLVKVQMRRVWERLLPEKSTVLFEAHSYVSSLKSDSCLSNEQKAVLNSLELILRQDY